MQNAYRNNKSVARLYRIADRLHSLHIEIEKELLSTLSGPEFDCYDTKTQAYKQAKETSESMVKLRRRLALALQYRDKSERVMDKAAI